MGHILKNKVAIVTGGGRGIGRAHCLALAEQGAMVVVNDPGVSIDGIGFDKSPADEVVLEINKKGKTAVANYDSVATSVGAANIIKTAMAEFGHLDILVNNAGVPGRQRKFWELTDGEWDMMMKVHLYGHFYCAREAVKIFLKQRAGRIINTSSIGGLGIGIGGPHYNTAKEGIVGLTRTLAHELGGDGITVNCIRPGASTRMSNEIDNRKFEAWVKQFGEEEAERKRAASTRPPEANSPLVVFLASGAADNVNGCIFDSGHLGPGAISIYRDPPETEATVWKDGIWTPEELIELLPRTLTAGKVRELPSMHS
jgi:NAD(P)-dependent dehydrogenase (short-subunit alcohol dehydrogenase family)